MRILIVGDWKWVQYEISFSQALEEHGVIVRKFSIADPSNFTFLNKIFVIFPFLNFLINQHNKSILQIALEENIEYVLFWRPISISPILLKKLSKYNIRTCSYNNDDPFNANSDNSLSYKQKFIWYWYKKCLPFFDFNFFFRPQNIEEAKLYKIKHSSILMPYFIPGRDQEIELSTSDIKKYKTDVVFVGHYENDGRLEYIKEMNKNNINFKIWGGDEWNKVLKEHGLGSFVPVEAVRDQEYRKAISGAKICLCFLSKINRDVYTRRNFEIPAFKRLLLSERTETLTKLFIEGEEAEFFSTPKEMASKIKMLLAQPSKIQNMSHSGYNNVLKNCHDINSRAKFFLEEITQK